MQAKKPKPHTNFDGSTKAVDDQDTQSERFIAKARLGVEERVEASHRIISESRRDLEQTAYEIDEAKVASATSRAKLGAKSGAADPHTQAEKFEAAARELGCDEDEDRFKGVLRKLAKRRTVT